MHWKRERLGWPLIFLTFAVETLRDVASDVESDVERVVDIERVYNVETLRATSLQ